MQPILRACRRALLAVLAGGTLVLVFPGVASAHVTVHPDSTTVGDDAVLTFRVPCESATASTVKVVVTLPSDPPLLDVSVQPVPGWRSTVTQATLPKPVVVDGDTLTRAVHQVTWTASPGAGIRPGEFQQFPVAVDSIPQASLLSFPADQYYSDGSVVHWNQQTVPGQAEPEHPAPAFAPTTDSTVAAAPPHQSDPLARWLAVAALVAGLLALVVAISGRRTRRTLSPS
jgi:periplasmic copper chaperone A